MRLYEFRKLLTEKEGEKDQLQKIERFGLVTIQDLTLKEIIKKINYWFKSGEFSDTDYTLSDIDQRTSFGGAVNSISVEIVDASHLWKMNFSIDRVSAIKEKGIKYLTLELKGYNSEADLLVTNLEYKISVDEINAEYFKKLLSDSKKQIEKYDASKADVYVDGDTENKESKGDLKDNLF
jgi:hypothetical protein